MARPTRREKARSQRDRGRPDHGPENGEADRGDHVGYTADHVLHRIDPDKRLAELAVRIASIRSPPPPRRSTRYRSRRRILPRSAACCAGDLHPRAPWWPSVAGV